MAFHELAQKYGPIMTMYFGSVRVVQVSSTKLVKQALVAQGKEFNARAEPFVFNDPNLSDGFIFAQGDEWQSSRRWLVKGMRDVGLGKNQMVMKINDEVEHLIALIDSKQGEMLEPLNSFIEPVCSIICGIITSHPYDPKNPQMKRAFDSICAFMKQSNLSNFIHFCFPMLSHVSSSPNGKKVAEAYDAFIEMIVPIIEARRKDFVKNSGEPVRDLIDLYLETEDTDQGIDVRKFSRAMAELFAAGQDTSIKTLAWLLLFVTMNPEIQKRCQREIDAVIDTDRMPQPSDRQKLVYIEAVINETSRLAGVAGIGALHSNWDIHRQIEGYDIPPYTAVVYNSHALHRDADYWDNPKEFRPERWLDGDGKLVNHGDHYMPFGAGPRFCLGEQLAKAEMFHFTVALLQRFDFKLETQINDFDDGDFGFTNEPPSFKVSVKRRVL